MTRNFKALIVYVCLSLWASALSAQGHWTFDYRQFRYDMTVYFSLQNGDNPVTNLSDYEVAAFVGNECRGVAVFEKQTGQNGQEVQYGFLKIYSNKAEGESVVLKCFYKDVAKERDFTDVIPFVSDSYVSYPSNPLPLKLEYQVDVQSAFADMGTVEGGGIKQSGSSATITAIPNEGYKFVRWSDGNTGNPYRFTVNKDVSLTAEFAAKEYTMTFVLDNGQDNIVMKQDYKTMVTAPAEPEKLGFTFNGWNYQVPTTMPARDTTFTAQWTRNSYNLKFMNGDEVISEATVLYGDPITKPANPTKEGYVFTGWSPSVDITMPAHDQEYTAQFSINRNTVTFLFEGKSVKSDSLDYGSKIVAPDDPVKTGYTFKGWTPLVPETMPDSSMTFTAKFEINTHQVTWNIDGQSLVVPVVYNTTITQPADTVKTGYTFTGWDAAIPELMPDSNLTFTAQFTVNKYLVKFIVDEDVKEDSLAYGTAITKPADPTKEGYTFTGWSPTVLATVPARDVTYEAQFSINKYNVTFVSDGQIVKSGTLGYGSTIEKPADPVKTGYTFKCWTPEVPATMPDSSMTFTAKFEINTYQVTWIIGGESHVVPVVYNTTIPKHSDPEKEGYTFNGWGAAIPELMPDSNLTFTAQFTVNKYLVKFIVDEDVKEDSLAYGTAITKPADPTKEGYTFTGWSPTVLATVPARDVTYEAQFSINKYNVTFVSKGEILKSDSLAYGSPIVAPDDTIVVGNTFLGWTPEVDATVPAHDVTYTASFEIKMNYATFIVGDAVLKSDSLAYGSPIVAPDDPVKTGYTFIGWQPEVPATMPDSSMTFTAKFEINTYQVTWIIGGESHVVPVVYNTTITQPADTVKTGYTFTGWDAAIPELMPAGDLTFTAQFAVNQYQVKFIVDEDVKEDSLAYGTVITKPADPTKVGYTFTSWNPALPDGATVPANDVTYTAQFKINQHHVTFVSNNSIVKSEDLTYGSTIVAPADTVRTGYTFKGWTPEVPATMPDSSMTFTAKFEINSYQVTWNIDGQSLVVPVVYNATITQPANTVKTGYTFTGWDAAIPELMPDSNLTFTAQFTVNKYLVKFIVDEDVQADSLAYGTVITKPADPTKVGYTFTSWNPALPDGATVPANDVTYTAQFKINQHHVTFVSNDSIVKSEDLTYGSTIVAPADTVRTGYTFKGWQPAIPEEMPDSNMTFTAKFEINTYQVTWNVDGKSYVDSVAYNKAITKPADPTKEGYTFIDWDAAIPELMPDRDLTFEALFAINKYQVTFIVDEDVKSDSLDYGAAITKPDNPTKEGYTFTGWSPAVLDIVPARDVTYTAQFTINQYAVTFLVGTDTLSTTKQDFGSDIIAPNAPKKTGFTFKDWDPEVPVTLPSHDVTFTALYERNRYLAIFVIDGDTLQADSVAYEAEIQIPADTVKTGYTFSGWQPEVLDSMPANDVTFTAHWTVNKYNVIYIVNDQEWARDEVAYGDSIVLREYASDERYTFNGWVSNDEQVYTTMPDHDVTYTADITDGIMTLFRNAEYADIYTITGKLVGRNLTVKQMKQLPRGLYIVNGKRIMVK